ncbi:ATP-binding protein [Nocardiopsis sp. LOL_012]|uniref:ATP-binding protein n=1 Tax=Nocardiopsis sp. LOL_012 TaxID=3345409 RepID=UPI003A879B12
MVKQISLPSDDAMVPIARHGVAALLGGFSRLADVELVLTEFVTSAVRSSSTDVAITVEHGVAVRIEVHDRRGRHPRADGTRIDSDAPEGLAVVSALADRFGAHRHRSGDRTAWAVFVP